MSNIAVKGNTDTAYEVELRDLVKPLGFADHNKCRERFDNYIGQFVGADSAYHYESTTYISSNKKEVSSRRLTRVTAISFSIYCDPVKGKELLEVQYHKSIQQQAQLVLAKDTEIAQLTSDLAKVRSKVVFTNSSINRYERSKELMELVNDGILDVQRVQVSKNIYTLTRYGKQLGYTQNSSGKVIEP